MTTVSNKLLGMAMGLGALVAAVGLSVQTPDFATDIQAAPDSPAHVSPAPPSPPAPPPAPANGYNPNQDYWTGQGSAGGAPGGAGGGAGGGGGGGAGGGG